MPASLKTGRNRATERLVASEGAGATDTAKTHGPAFAPIERREIATLKPYERNARLHDEQQLLDLRASMVEFGWTIPVLIDEDGGVLAGHARIQVGAELGYTDAPVIVAAGWTEAQKRAYILADNKLTERGGWNWEMVAAELKDIRDMGVDLALTGFEAHEFEPLLEADWRTAATDDGGKADDSPHGATDAHAITVTSEQYEVIRRAVEKERERTGQPKMSEGKALEMIAERTCNE
jgi:ParB-like chromosome segregation protein Spo0J